MAFVLKAHNVFDAATTNGFTSATFDSTGANVIAVALAETDAATGVVSDNKSNSFVQKTIETNGGGNSPQISWWIGTGGSFGTGHTLTVTGTGTFPTLCMSCWSGSNSTPFDVQNGGVDLFGNTVDTGGVTPNNANSLVLAAAGINGGDSGNAKTASAGFTVLDDVAEGSSFFGVVHAYIIETSIAAQDCVFTLSASGVSTWASVIMVLKPSAGGVVDALEWRSPRVMSDALFRRDITVY
jgi:hypothetical protein